MSRWRFITRLSIAPVSPTFWFLLRFARTMILSRLLVPDDLGAAVALMSILASCELVTDVGLNRYVMVSHGPARAQAVAVAQQISLWRGVLLAALLVVFAPALADSFGAPGLAGSVAWLSLAAFIRGLRNWRVDQVQQDYRYGPETIAVLGGGLASVIVIIPSVALFHDHRAILVSLIAESLVYVVLSHVLMPRERVPTVDPAARRVALAYCLPLMVNGLGLMVMKQMDQVLIANLFDLSTLAVYALGLNLAITPTSPLQAILQKIGLPFLFKQGGDPESSRRASQLIILASTLLAAAYALPAGAVLDWLVPVIYGQAYHVTAAFAALAAFDAFLRFCRGGPNTVMLHTGQTRRLTIGNLTGAIGLLAGLLLALVWRRIESVVAGLVVGDVVSLLVLLWLMRRHIPFADTMWHVAWLTAVVGSGGLALWLFGGLGAPTRVAIVAVGGAAVMLDVGVLYLGLWKRPAARWHRNARQTAGAAAPHL